MIKRIATETQQRLENFLSTVETAQKLQDDILKYGLNAAYLYCEDLEGDWLERWGEDEQESNYLRIMGFLESDDGVALTVRKLLKYQTLPHIAVELEKCLVLQREEDKVFAVKTFLVDSIFSRESNYSFGDAIDLLDLASQLVNKLADILGEDE